MVDNASHYLDLDNCVLSITNRLAYTVRIAIYDNDGKKIENTIRKHD
jgi:hypothetical protein